ncbi:LacI family DNA-binding transcriptional regulator [Pseudarthrobacter sp. NPDC089323]
MGAKPTSVDVARAAGVSQSTVSRTFRNDPKVLPATRQRVISAAELLGYYPDEFARNMVTGRSGIIAVVVPDVVNPVFPAIITRLHEELQQRGLRMMLFLERNYEKGPHDILGAAGMPVDGVILTSATVTSPVVAEIVKRKIPSVLMQRDSPMASVDRVMPDDVAGCAAAASHLVAQGHRRIGIIAGSPQTSSGKNRKDHFAHALNSSGVVLQEQYTRVAEPSFDGSVAAATSLLSMDPRPTAIFCASDTIAITALDVAHRMGIEVPRDVSIVGFDDIGAAAWSMIDLTTVRQDLDEQCRQALSMLLERIDGYAGPARSVISPVELVVRESTGAPADRHSARSGRQTA